jgi:tetratricopeptide (TPR) repeat protein
VTVLYPNLIDAYLGLIEAKWALHDFAGVIEDLNQFIRISLSIFQSPDPGFAWYYTQRGFAKSQTGDLQGALEDYTQAIYNDSGYVDAYMGRGHINNALGKPDDARRDFAKAMSLNPAVAQAFTTLQLAELMGKVHAPAAGFSDRRGAEEALELNRRGGELYQAGRYTEALPLAQKALEIREKAFGLVHPDVAASLHNLALLYQAMGDHAKAEPLFRRSVEINEKIFSAEKKGEADTSAR